MSRILAYTSPGRGHLFPVTPILDELARREHEIDLRTLASRVPKQHFRRALGVRAETGHLLLREQPAAVRRQLRDFIDVRQCDRTC